MWIHKPIMIIVASARFITAHATLALFFNVQMPRLYLFPPHEEDTLLTPCEHEVKVVGSQLVAGLKSFSARWLYLHS
jgi:hypothetical protein